MRNQQGLSVMEETHSYQYVLGELSQTNGQRLSLNSFTSAEQTGHQTSVPQGLPSFEGFYRSIVKESWQKKDTETSVSDQSSDSSEPSFTIESIMREDSTSGPRSSTPYIPHGSETNQPGPCVPTQQPGTHTQQLDILTQQPGVPPKHLDVEKVDRVKESAAAQLDKHRRSGPRPKPYKRHEDKPPYTYVAMCATAIELSEEKALTVGDIRKTLQRMFPFFQGPYTGWKESVRHCLSRGKCFSIVDSPTDSEPGRRLWKVNRSLLKPDLFRRTKHGAMAALYLEYLHDQLGVAPVCDHQTSHKRTSIILPSQRCFQKSPTVTTEVCESDDFLRARKEAYGDTDDARSDMTTPRASSVASDWSVASLLGKRKQDSNSEPTTKTAKPSHADHVSPAERITGSTVGYGSQNFTHYPGNSAYDFGQHQMPQYQNPHNQMPGYQMPHYQMPAFYPPSTQAVPFYRQPRIPTPTGTSQGGHNGDMTTAFHYHPYWANNTAMQTAMHRLYHQQYRPSMIREQDRGFSYDYRWYAPPEAEVPEESSVDLSVKPDKE